MNISTISPAKFDTGKSVTLSGTGFGSSQGTVTIGGQAQAVTSWSDEEIVFTSARGAQSMGACRVDVVAASGATGTLIFSDAFTSGSPTGWTTYGAQNGGTLAVVDGAWKGAMAASVADVTVYAVKNIAASSLSELYISFRSKMPASTHGIKFLKIFGQNNAGTYANVTFGLDYSGLDNGGMLGVSYGDGTTTANDTQRVIFFDSARSSVVGRAPSPVVSRPMNADFASTDWGADWHTFKLKVKFNSGTSALNEVADGEFYVEIDGSVYLNATGIFNRHYSNGPIDSIQLFGYAGGTPPSNWEIWYDDVVLSAGGFV